MQNPLLPRPAFTAAASPGVPPTVARHSPGPVRRRARPNFALPGTIGGYAFLPLAGLVALRAPHRYYW